MVKSSKRKYLNFNPKSPFSSQINLNSSIHSKGKVDEPFLPLVQQRLGLTEYENYFVLLKFGPSEIIFLS